MDLEEINRNLRLEMELINNRPIDQFEGRSPKEMYYMINHPFDENSPMQIKKVINESWFDQVPLLKMTRFFLDTIQCSDNIKLTDKGNLPVKIVKAIYDLRLFPSEYIDGGFCTIRSEEDFHLVHIMNIVCQLSGLVKKQNNRMSLTQKAKKIIKNDSSFDLFRELLVTYTTKLNWAYKDFYGDHQLAQTGFTFSLELVSKYGDKELPAHFYAKKYFKAFPMMLDLMSERHYDTVENRAIKCYSHRSFHFFMELFGFVELIEKGEDKFRKELFIRKTEVLDRIFHFDE